MSKKLNATDNRVLEYAKSNLNNLGYCTHSNAQIAETLGMKEVTVKKALGRLTKKPQPVL